MSTIIYIHTYHIRSNDELLTARTHRLTLVDIPAIHHTSIPTRPTKTQVSFHMYI